MHRAYCGVVCIGIVDAWLHMGVGHAIASKLVTGFATKVIASRAGMRPIGFVLGTQARYLKGVPCNAVLLVQGIALHGVAGALHYIAVEGILVPQYWRAPNVRLHLRVQLSVHSVSEY